MASVFHNLRRIDLRLVETKVLQEDLRIKSKGNVMLHLGFERSVLLASAAVISASRKKRMSIVSDLAHV